MNREHRYLMASDPQMTELLQRCAEMAQRREHIDQQIAEARQARAPEQGEAIDGLE